MSHVIQACAAAAVARQYTYFAITDYGVCVWGPDGLTVSSTRQADSWCFHGLGGPWLVSVYKIKSSSKGEFTACVFTHCFGFLWLTSRENLNYFLERDRKQGRFLFNQNLCLKFHKFPKANEIDFLSWGKNYTGRLRHFQAKLEYKKEVHAEEFSKTVL